MASGGVGFAQVSFGYAVKTEEQVVVIPLQIHGRIGCHGPDVFGMIEIGRHDREGHRRGDVRDDFPHSLDGGLKAGHCEVRKERDEEQVADAFIA